MRVKLTDFGIAKLLDAQGVTSTGQVLGSPRTWRRSKSRAATSTRAPTSSGWACSSTSAWSVTCRSRGQNPAQVLRRVLDGLYPPAERSARTVGKRLSTILDRALAHEAEDRFESANAMRDALLAELKRVGVESPRARARGVLRRPGRLHEGAREAHDRASCAISAQIARKGERVLDAAADYNRALAYAPDDPQLLRIVASMQQDAARAALIKRAWPLALLAVVVLVGAYFGTQALKNRTQPVASNNPSASASMIASTSPSASASTSTSTTAVTSATVPASATTTATTGTVVVQHVERTITLNVLPASFFVSDNGRELENHTTGDTLKVDEKDHVLVFTCPKSSPPDVHDLCDAQTRKISAGKADETVSLELHPKAATLTVQFADATATFSLDEAPTLVIKPGVPVPVNVPSYRYVMLYNRANPSNKHKVDLQPGGTQSVTF